MKKDYFIGIGIFVIFMVFSVNAFKTSLSPYVSFAEAKSLEGRNIQIKGVLVRGYVSSGEGDNFRFVLRNEAGEEIFIAYQGGKPSGFEQGRNVVAIGKYHNGQFDAEKVLVKCPSKYERAQGSVR